MKPFDTQNFNATSKCCFFEQVDQQVTSAVDNENDGAVSSIDAICRKIFQWAVQ
jgi:hypothetical protein